MIDFYYKAKNFIKNCPRFLYFAWNYRNWDVSFATEIFAANIEDVGRAIKNGWHKNSIKEYRRCLQAAAMLRQNFVEPDTIDTRDKSSWNNAKNKKIKIEHKEGRRYFTIDYKYGVDYAKKIEGVTNKRLENWRKQRRKDTLEFINKHYDRWWD